MTKTRPSKTKQVKAGHLPIAELHSPLVAASSPFGDNLEFPLPVDLIHYESSSPVPPRIDSEA
ncbi:hypothetical protein [Stackebrandtia soli]|uniref:hypothetical protein n=1 Tax=Stackebrandtia soli TaxID=1892856 RepID=UPI0039EC36AC